MSSDSTTQLGACDVQDCDTDAVVEVSNGPFTEARCDNHDCSDSDHIEVVSRAE